MLIKRRIAAGDDSFVQTFPAGGNRGSSMRNGASAARDKRSIETSNGPLTREQPRLHVFERENERGEERENKIVL